MRSLKRLTVKGFKSIEDLKDFDLGSINILIGANGAGKSNFVDVFRLLREVSDQKLQELTINRVVDSFFYMGPQNTPFITFSAFFGDNQYGFQLGTNERGSFVIKNEYVDFVSSHYTINTLGLESKLKDEARLKGAMGGRSISYHVERAISSWVVYHFHDTGTLAPMRREQSVRDSYILRDNASNIAAFLYGLFKNDTDYYELIRAAITEAAPFFEDFILRPEKKGENEVIRLEWKQKGSDFPFQPHQLSDGTIRFICLATALLQPRPPSTIVIDEPELGLHPYAIEVLAGLVKSSASRTQVILSTQSPLLIDHFEPEDIITVNRHQGKSVFERLERNKLEEWLKTYSIGELWQKNVIEGSPTYD